MASSLLSAVVGAVASASADSAAGKAAGAASSAFINGGVKIGNITNARVYLNSGSLMGMAEKVDGLGMPKFKSNEYKALGMHSTVSLPAGLEQPEIKISWNSLYGNLAQYLHNPMAVVRFQIIGAHEYYDANGLAKVGQVVMHVHGMVSAHSEPSVESGSPVKTETTFKVTYSKAIVDGIEQYEYDVFNNIYKANGVDIFGAIDGSIGG